ncbi:MurR/RpiR family transcriptional regulator [Desnuesiella massiliensis]|uniref:MurR/RpiR family transcriptional regulator n=1 Tax=Desnuesiella massiliensis TaxID=1650662 RepID=UPI0006E2B58C|nr:MurR/RpiR family transcriptional regulator [Desnuesiella massiliensis]
MDIKLKIESNLENLSNTEVKIARFILDNTSTIKNMTSSELAEKIGVGQSTIIKFIKKFGFNGFLDFKIKLSESLAKEKSNTRKMHDDISLEDPLKDVYFKLVEESIRSIQGTYQNIDFSELEATIELLNNSSRIVLIGIGNSGLVAKDFNNKLLKIGKTPLFSEDLHVSLSIVPSLTEQDCCIVFSYSGKTKEIVEISEKIKEKKCPVIAITSNMSSPLAKLSDKILCTISAEGLLRTSAMSSRITQLSIVDILFLGLVQKNYDPAISKIQQGRHFVGWEK